MKAISTILFDWGGTLMVDFPGESGPMCRWKKVEAVEGAEACLREVSRDHACYLATNAADSSAEDIRLALARVGLDPYLKGVFCFRSLGHAKPSPAFFDAVLAWLGEARDRVVLVGDDHGKDYRGALDCGLRAILFDPLDRHPEVPDRMRSLAELPGILSSLETDAAADRGAGSTPSPPTSLRLQN